MINPSQGLCSNFNECKNMLYLLRNGNLSDHSWLNSEPNVIFELDDPEFCTAYYISDPGGIRGIKIKDKLCTSIHVPGTICQFTCGESKNREDVT